MVPKSPSSTVFWSVRSLAMMKNQAAGVKSWLRSCVALGRLPAERREGRHCCREDWEVRYPGQCQCSRACQLSPCLCDLSWKTLLLGMGLAARHGTPVPELECLVRELP